jgi:hypothetical protein
VIYFFSVLLMLNFFFLGLGLLGTDGGERQGILGRKTYSLDGSVSVINVRG